MREAATSLPYHNAHIVTVKFATYPITPAHFTITHRYSMPIYYPDLLNLY